MKLNTTLPNNRQGKTNDLKNTKKNSYRRKELKNLQKKGRLKTFLLSRAKLRINSPLSF